MIADLFGTVITVSLAVSAVVLPLILCSSRINRRFAVRWKYWIWLLLTLRLLLLWNPALPVTAMTVPLPPAAGTAKAQVQQLPAPAAAPTAIPAAPAVTVPAEAAPHVSLTLVDGLAAVWVLGAGVFFLAQAARHLHFCHDLRRWGKPVTQGMEYEILQAEASRMGLRAPKLLCSKVAQSPLMTGFFRPVLALPQEDYPPEQLSLILRHELTHLRRRDLWYKLLLLTANAVHWFNPIVYLMVREANLDLEISCDHAVAQALDPEDRRVYSEAILDALHRRQRRASSLSTYFWSGTTAMKERFRAILDTNRRRKGIAAFLAVASVAGLAGGLVSCETQSDRYTLSTPAGITAVPVSISLELPEGWSMEYSADGNTDGFSILDVRGEQIGQGSFSDFDWYPNAGNYRAVYSSIMLGSVATWDNEYTPVKNTETTETATCRPVYREPAQGQSMAEAPEYYYKGILSYDARLLTYVTLLFEDEAITQEQLTEIAQSLTLASAEQHSAQEVYGIEEALAALERALIDRGIVQPGLLAADGRALHWSTDQMRVTHLDEARTMFVSLEDEQWSTFGEYAVRLDGGGFYQCPEQGLAVQLDGTSRFQYTKGKWEPLSEELSAAQALEQLKSSIHLEQGEIRFQLPALYRYPERWEIHISGRTEADGMGMSVHYLEQPSEAKSWQAGAQYSFRPEGVFTELTMTVSFTGEAVSEDIDLLPYLRGEAAGLGTVAGLAQSLSAMWLDTWNSMDGPKSGRIEELPKVLPLAIDLNADGQVEIGLLYNGNLKVQGDSAILAFYQLGPEGFEEYAVLEGLPWLYDSDTLELYRDEEGKVILHATRPEAQDGGTLYHECYYTFFQGVLVTDELLRQETGTEVVYLDSGSRKAITEGEYNRLLSQIIPDIHPAAIYHLYAERMGSELFTGEEPGEYLAETLEELL